MRAALVALVMVAVACSAPEGRPVASKTPSPVASAPPVKLSTGGVVEYAVPALKPRPASCLAPCPMYVGSLALGADGNIWFAASAPGVGVVGRITPSGEIKQFVAPYELVGGAQTIAAGPDGNIWVGANGGGSGKPDWILRVSPTGQFTRMSAGQNPGNDGFGTGPESITRGPDGNMWFTEFWTSRIGRLTPQGVLTEFPAAAGLRGITTGPDGNLWFVEEDGAIGRITPQGMITEFPIPSANSDENFNDIVAGPDGNLWFTGNGLIGRISTKGEVTPIALPQGSSPRSLVAGPDGNLWFTDDRTNAIVRLSTTGAVRTFPLARRSSGPQGIAVGGDGRIWFGETDTPSIASIGVKVPEVLTDRRPVVFSAASSKTVTLRNTGDAPLVISSTRLTGVDAKIFVTGSNTCAGKALAPDATCTIEIKHPLAGPAGLRTAMLEVADNATGSPQRLSLVAQVPHCTLPVLVGGTDEIPTQGQRLDLASARVLNDPSGRFEASVPGHVASGVRTTSPPSLSGQQAGYFDSAAGRWLPVPSSAFVSPDGSRYAYMMWDAPRSEVHVVDVRTGQDRVLPLSPAFWSILAFTAQGIYLHTSYEAIGAGLWLLDPDSGRLRTVFTDGIVNLVDGGAAWIQSRNTADKLPDPSQMGPGQNEIVRRDLATGKSTVWLYRPGTNLYVVAVVNGMPVVSVYDGVANTYWILSGPNKAAKMEFGFTTGRYPAINRFTGDAAGVWIGSDDGVYLWTARTGAVLMTNDAAMPAGKCA